MVGHGIGQQNDDYVYQHRLPPRVPEGSAHRDMGGLKYHVVEMGCLPSSPVGTTIKTPLNLRAYGID